jgi:hypothetical protein
MISESLQTIPIHRNGFAIDLRVAVKGPNDTAFLIVSTDSCKILVFCSDKKNFNFVPTHQVRISLILSRLEGSDKRDFNFVK